MASVLATAGAALPQVAAAQAVVVRATGPSAAAYPVGRKLAAGATVKLEKDDAVTVLDQAGTRIMKGKGSFTIDSRVMRDRSTMMLLSRSLNNPQTVRAGAVRGLPMGDSGEPAAPTVWLADIDRGGKVCVPQGSDLYLWRTNSDARRFTWFSEADGGGMVRLQWPRRTAGIAWPAAVVPPISGRSYRSTDDAVPGTEPGKGVEFEVVTLAPDSVPEDPDALASLLIERGCLAQVDLLASNLERRAAATAIEGPAH
ncbi:hypothetical protein ACFO0A_06730 [Novosphingobium tardum]|uniref:DUF4412 domain-containing protein n=1 Tax=Novosphingobium tardum TaxID=1538021 RepID=A0ABV8RPK3_9SPHN